MITRWLYRLSGVALVLWGAGCSGLSPGGDDDPIPEAGCLDTIEIFLPLNGAVVPVGTETLTALPLAVEILCPAPPLTR